MNLDILKNSNESNLINTKPTNDQNTVIIINLSTIIYKILIDIQRKMMNITEICRNIINFSMKS